MKTPEKIIMIGYETFNFQYHACIIMCDYAFFLWITCTVYKNVCTFLISFHEQVPFWGYIYFQIKIKTKIKKNALSYHQ